MNQPPVIPSCDTDPRHPTDWVCTGCGKGWCNQCVSRIGLRHAYEVCPICHERCEKLDHVLSGRDPKRTSKRRTSQEAGPGTWLGILGRAWIRPLQPPSVFLLLLGGSFLGAFKVVAIFSGILGMIGLFVIYGILAQYWLALVRAEANGDEGLLDPELDRVSLVHGLFMLYFAVPLFLLGPGGLVILIGYQSAGKVLMGIGLFLVPMALIAVALFSSGWAANPVFWIRSVITVFFPYTALVLSVGICVAVQYVLGLGVDNVLQQSGRFTGAFLIASIKGVFLLYFLWVAGRILGGFYRTYEHRIGWSG